MNGLAPPGAPPVQWQELKAADGRTYYYNTASRKTQWTKPVELMTDEERALDGTSWSEYKSPEGKPYWHNRDTGDTTWKLPDSIQAKMEAYKQQRQPPPRPQASQWSSGPPSLAPRNDRDDYQPPERRDRERDTGYPDRERSTFAPSSEVQFASEEEAEAAFTKVLKQLKVQPDWEWERVIRAGIKDPNWRAVREPEKREEVFRKYCEDLRAQEKTKEAERQAKLRTDFITMLRSHPEIKHYTRWKTALPILADEAIFRSAKDDTERRQLFEEYLVSLTRDHAKKETENKKTALEDLTTMLKGLELEPFTRWHNAEQKLEEQEVFNSEKYQPLNRLDVLLTFQTHIRQLQREHNDRVQAERLINDRVERKNRDAFKDLLKELTENGKLKLGTLWKDIHDLIQDDPRYTAMLGQGGSSPLELFWDELEEADGKFRTLRRHALDVLGVIQWEVQLTTPYEEFETVMRNDPRASTVDPELPMIDDDLMRKIYDYVIIKVEKRLEAEQLKAEHDARQAIDSLRSVIRRLDPPVSITDSWEAVRPRLEKSEEYKALATDKLREAAFVKYINRLKEKEKEADRRDRSRREPRDRERDRDRRDRGDREFRNGHSGSRRHRTRTRSPEHDPYAAERRQAQQDREARYRNNEPTGLSPPFRRPTRERDEFRPERPRQGSGDHYGHERREREVERERTYVSRADPRERSVSELDYGDGRPVSVSTRRRRDSDGSAAAKRDPKRARLSPRPEVKAKTPVAVDPPKEDPALRSGSEEGEIEED
ncbi:hypothetical protein BDV95DRAFT_583654 [Massariosphaeria phaeospora]|uniref:Formin binding protein-like protein n=1 Tax=Massariosphaeria phaeospora TaxID=100035 RepID=A0A7C8HZW1_9PLEO|nr:hypothetical protein BDV95DRAFT_583654 [Massariosphaeria phaeospora]